MSMNTRDLLLSLCLAAPALLAGDLIVRTDGALLCRDELRVSSGRITIESGGEMSIAGATVIAQDVQLDAGASLHASGTLAVAGCWINESDFVQPDSLTLSNTVCSLSQTNLATGSGDTDGDGISDRGEGSFDVNANLVADYMDPSCSVACDHIPVEWLAAYGLATDGSADGTDSDRDGSSNWEEYHAMTDPGDPDSVLKITSLDLDDASGEVAVTWKSVTTRTYDVEYGSTVDALTGEPSVAAAVVSGASNTTTTVLAAPGDGNGFIRVRVNP